MCRLSRLTLSTPNKCTASGPKPRLQRTQIQTHPRNERAPPVLSRGRGPQTLKGAGSQSGWQPTQRARHSTELFPHECSTLGIRIIIMSQELRFLYWVNKRMVEKAFRLPLDQWFSKCGTWTSSISITWEHVRDAKDRAPACNQKLWGWSPAVCILIKLPGTSDACLTLRPLLYPARNSKILKNRTHLSTDITVWLLLCWSLCNLLPLPLTFSSIKLLMKKLQKIKYFLK